MSDAHAAYESFQRGEGRETETSEWFTIDQESVDRFAEVTRDLQFIHVDPERAAQSPFGGPIAHGFLTLSLLSHLRKSTQRKQADPVRTEHRKMGINYGFDRVRFIHPVRVGSRIRLQSLLSRVTLKGDAVELVQTMTIEIEGEEKPALVAEWITRSVYG